MRAENAAPGAANSLKHKEPQIEGAEKSAHSWLAQPAGETAGIFGSRGRGRYEGHTSFFKLLYRVNYERRKT